MLERIKAAAQFLAEKFEDFFGWMTDRWYRIGTYLAVVTVTSTVALIVDFSWFWLVVSVIAAVYTGWLTRVAWLNEQDMIARVEEALAEVDFSDTSRWIGPDDEGYPKRPER